MIETEDVAAQFALKGGVVDPAHRFAGTEREPLGSRHPVSPVPKRAMVDHQAIFLDPDCSPIPALGATRPDQHLHLQNKR
jgi:hypothetical protein